MVLRSGTVPIGLTGVLVALCATAAAQVDYADEVSDEMDDVYGVYTGDTGPLPAIDILSVETSESGGVLNASMTLAGNYTVAGNYSVMLLVDGQWRLGLYLASYYGDFLGDDPRDYQINVTGSVSGDGTTISWELALEEVDADHNVTIESGTAELSSGWTTVQQDVAEPGAEATFEAGPISLEVRYTVTSDARDLWRRVNIVYYGQSAGHFRHVLDLDGDGSVSGSEYERFMDAMRDPTSPWTVTTMTLNDEPATSTRLHASLPRDQVVGPVGEDVTIRLETELAMTFPEPRTTPYEYCWHDELIDGRGIPYWWVNDGSKFRILIGGGRQRFTTSQLDPVEASFYDDKNRTFQMDGPDLRAHWNDTMMESEGFRLIRTPKEPEGDEDKPCSIWERLVVFPPALLAYGLWRRRRAPA